MVHWLTDLYVRLFRSQWDAINSEAAEERAQLGGRFDARPLWVLVLVALILVAEEYWGDRPTFLKIFPSFGTSHWVSLGEFAWWSGAKIVGYLLLPALVVRLAGISLKNCGLKWQGIGKHLWIYVVLYLAILPVIVVASYTGPFQNTYPFYRLVARSWTDFLAWEAMYLTSFFALEFFFRGFMLFLLRRSLGAYSIFVMCVPYCMIHFHKPVTEVIGAIFAGIILGTLALRTRSIWCGVFIHISVAVTMDILAMIQVMGWPGAGRFVGW